METQPRLSVEEERVENSATDISTSLTRMPATIHYNNYSFIVLKIS